MRMRRKKNLLPRLEACGAYRILQPETLRGRWRSLYPQAEQLWVEIGCGKGSFTVETARQNPHALLIAIERVADAMVMAMEKAKAAGLHNVFFLCADASTLTDIFAPGEADRIFLNFSDPWPSKRHCRRRLTHAGFLLAYRQVLGEGGEIHFKTDNRPLFDYSMTQFPAAGYAVSEVNYDLHAQGVWGVMTDYEAKFAAEGVPINRCVATVGALPEPFVMPEDMSLIPFGYAEGTKYGR